MKRRRQGLIALNAALAPILTIVTSFVSSNIPSIPGFVLWIIAGTIFVVAIVVSIIVSISENDKEGPQGTISPLAVPQANAQTFTGVPRSTLSQTKNKPKTSLLATAPSSVLPATNIQTHRDLTGSPTVGNPRLICLALDVSHSMRDPVMRHTGKTLDRWTSVTEALDHFAHLGVAWFKDPTNQKEVLPLYHLMAYGFGFTERTYKLGLSKTRGGEVRDLLNHPTLISLPSAADLSEHWSDYKDNLLNFRKYTMDLFGSSPMCQALVTIRDRIKEEQAKKHFAAPTLLLIISDGQADDGDPLPIIEDLHRMDVMTLCCYLANENVLATQKLYGVEDTDWADETKRLFLCASSLQNDNEVSRAIFNYLDDAGWQPFEGARLFAQVNQTEGLNTFLEILLQGALVERKD